VFNHPCLVLAWFKTIGLREGIPVLIKGDLNQRIVYFPMELHIKRYWRYEQKILYAMGGPIGFDFQDPLISGENVSSMDLKMFWEALFDVIRRKVPECAQIVIPRLRHSMVAGAFNSMQSTVSPYIDLDAYNKLDDVLSKCKASHRGDVKRQIRRLGQKGHVTMHIFLPDEKQAALDELPRFIKTWERQWGNTWMAGMEAFYRYLIDDMLETGLIHFSILKCGDEPIHWHFGFLHDNRLHWFKPTYNVSWKNYSPGKVHIAYLIEECLNNKIRYFDFLYGDEAYKYDWEPTEEKLYCIEKWNGFRPFSLFVEQFVKPSYRFSKYKCFYYIIDRIKGNDYNNRFRGKGMRNRIKRKQNQA